MNREAYLAWARDCADHVELDKAKDHARASMRGSADLEELLADMETVHAAKVCSDETPTYADLDNWSNSGDWSSGDDWNTGDWS